MHDYGFTIAPFIVTLNFLRYAFEGSLENYTSLVNLTKRRRLKN